MEYKGLDNTEGESSESHMLARAAHCQLRV
jgi:hypothetical protein